MKGILADVNIQGYVDHLVALMQTQPWALYWDHLQLRYVHFDEIDLEAQSSDALVWKKCQELQLFLVTDNRNADDPDSLETTIRTMNTAASLPVFTIGNVQRLNFSREYAQEVVEGLLEYLLQGDNLLGAGRLYLPGKR